MASQTQLSSLNAQIAVAQRKLQGLKADVESKTTKLLDEQQVKLKTEQDDNFKQINVSRQQLHDLKIEYSELVKSLTLIQEEVRASEQAAEQRRGTLTMLEGELQSAYAELKELADQQTEVRQQTALLLTDLKQTQDLSAELGTEIDTLKQQRAELANLMTAEEATYEAVKADRVQEITKYDQRLLVLKQDILSSQKEQEITRKELASRARALDERDIILRRREYKTSQDEALVRNNANLLEL